MRLARPVLLAVACALTLAACRSRGAEVAAGGPSPTSSAGAGSDGDATAGAVAAAAGGPASCTSLELVEGARFTADELGACLVDYLRWAGKGREEVHIAGTVTTIDWRLADDGM